MSPRATARTTPPHVDTTREARDELTVHGRHVERGTELSVDGIRGRVAFVRHVRHEHGAEWVDVITARGFSRTVRPDAIRTVHRRSTGILAVTTAERRAR